MVNNLQGKALSLRHISWHCIRDEIPFSILSSYPDNSKPGTRSNIQALPHAWTKNECKMMIRKVHSIMKFYFCDSFHPFYLSPQYFYFYAFVCFLSFFLSYLSDKLSRRNSLEHLRGRGLVGSRRCWSPTWSSSRSRSSPRSRDNRRKLDI